MPGEVSRSSTGPTDAGPYIPSWLYRNGPKVCPCGHHEGYHGDNGICNQVRFCGCTGLPPECLTPFEDME